MEKLDRNFADFLRLLNKHKVKYLVIGGYAVGYHGFVRATGDLDVFVESTTLNATRLVTVFREFGFDVPELRTELFLEKKRIVRLGIPPIRLEVMNHISGVTFSGCFKKRIVQAFGDMKINFIDRESLIKNKKQADAQRIWRMSTRLPRNKTFLKVKAVLMKNLSA